MDEFDNVFLNLNDEFEANSDDEEWLWISSEANSEANNLSIVIVVYIKNNTYKIHLYQKWKSKNLDWMIYKIWIVKQ